MSLRLQREEDLLLSPGSRGHLDGVGFGVMGSGGLADGSFQVVSSTKAKNKQSKQSATSGGVDVTASNGKGTSTTLHNSSSTGLAGLAGGREGKGVAAAAAAAAAVGASASVGAKGKAASGKSVAPLGAVNVNVNALGGPIAATGGGAVATTARATAGGIPSKSGPGSVMGPGPKGKGGKTHLPTDAPAVAAAAATGDKHKQQRGGGAHGGAIATSSTGVPAAAKTATTAAAAGLTSDTAHSHPLNNNHNVVAAASGGSGVRGTTPTTPDKATGKGRTKASAAAPSASSRLRSTPTAGGPSGTSVVSTSASSTTSTVKSQTHSHSQSSSSSQRPSTHPHPPSPDSHQKPSRLNPNRSPENQHHAHHHKSPTATTLESPVRHGVAATPTSSSTTPSPSNKRKKKNDDLMRASSSPSSSFSISYQTTNRTAAAGGGGVDNHTAARLSHARMQEQYVNGQYHVIGGTMHPHPYPYPHHGGHGTPSTPTGGSNSLLQQGFTYNYSNYNYNEYSNSDHYLLNNSYHAVDASSSPLKRERGEDQRPYPRGKAQVPGLGLAPGQGLGGYPPLPQTRRQQDRHSGSGGQSDMDHPSFRVLSPFAVAPLTRLLAPRDGWLSPSSLSRNGEAVLVVSPDHDHSGLGMSGVGGGGRGGAVPLLDLPPLPPVSRLHVWTKAQQLLSSSIQQVQYSSSLLHTDRLACKSTHHSSPSFSQYHPASSSIS